MQKPAGRSKLRRYLGSYYYVLKKRTQWFFGHYTSRIDTHPMPIPVASHETPLYRKLKDVDMWMQKNKVVNLKLAVKKIHGIVVQPGETFSYWKCIGNPTRRKGYIEGMLLRDGKVIPGVGGGLCQLSNLLFWTTAHTPLTIVERWRHSYDVFPDSARTQPFGSGATCSYPNIDLQIRNDTGAAYQFLVEVTDCDLKGEWRAESDSGVGYEVEERNHSVRHELWGGYTRHNQLFRIAHNNITREQLGEECIAENHAVMMYDPMIE